MPPRHAPNPGFPPSQLLCYSIFVGLLATTLKDSNLREKSMLQGE